MDTWTQADQPPQPLEPGQLNETAKKFSYRSSDARWRTNLRVSFEVLKDTLCPEMNLETFGKNGRKILLERSLERIKTLESQLTDKGLNVNLVRESFAELEKKCFADQNCLKAFSKVFGRPINLTSSQRRPHKRKFPRPVRSGKAKRKIDFDAVADADVDEISASSSSATFCPAISSASVSSVGTSTPKKSSESKETFNNENEPQNFVDVYDLPDLSPEEPFPLSANPFGGDVRSSPSASPSSYGLSHMLESHPIDVFLNLSPCLDLFESLDK